MKQRRRQIALLAAVAAAALLAMLLQDPAIEGDERTVEEAQGDAHRSLLGNTGRALARYRREQALRDEAEAAALRAGAASGQGSGGVCFDDQQRDAWMTSRMICGEDLPPAYDVPGSTSDANIDSAKKDASVAICVIGKTRSFTSPLAQETLRTNLASSFGAGRTAFYFHLFPQDEKGTPRPWGLLTSNVRQTVDAALRVLRMDESAFVKKGQPPGMERYHHWVSEACGAEIVVDDRDSAEIFASGMQNYTAPRPIREFSGYFYKRGSGASDRGFIAQWTAVKDCYEFVKREEERRGRKFEYVIRTRPDMVYTRSMKPHCLYSSRDVWMQHDWTYILPRRVLDFLHRVYKEGVMAQSNPAFAGGHDDPEEYLFRMLNSELSRTEYAHDGCCDITPSVWPRRRGEHSPRRNDMVAGAMLLRPAGGDLMVCHFPNDFSSNAEECVNVLQSNRYNAPVVRQDAV